MSSSIQSLDWTSWDTPSTSSNEYNPFDNGSGLWFPQHDEEHLIVDKVRSEVLRYRLQSVATFGIPISVGQSLQEKFAGRITRVYPGFKIKIVFYDFAAHRFQRECRFNPDGKVVDVHKASGELLQVREGRGWVSVQDFLKKYFPVFDMVPPTYIMCDWWRENGKTFNWAGLPTEIMDNIIQCCMTESYEFGARYRYMPMFPQLSRKQARQQRTDRRREVTDQLGPWSALLRVSHQVRSIALRLCVFGSNELPHSQGMRIAAPSTASLSHSIKRLGKIFQVVEPHSVPVDHRTLALARKYRDHPRIYPELKQYATFCHGVRRIHLDMATFEDALGFFRVTIGGLERELRRPNYYIDYEIFQRCPNLKELVIILPDVDISFQYRGYGPKLFHQRGYACPRIIHRMIYERAAEVLAGYDKVILLGFMEEYEQQRFERLREKAVKALKFKPEDLEELYTKDTEGGIELKPEESINMPDVSVQEAVCKSLEGLSLKAAQRAFWPPKCKCSMLCEEFLKKHGVPNTKFSLDEEGHVIDLRRKYSSRQDQ